jgi:hypothetical protein
MKLSALRTQTNCLKNPFEPQDCISPPAFTDHRSAAAQQTSDRSQFLEFK